MNVVKLVIGFLGLVLGLGASAAWAVFLLLGLTSHVLGSLQYCVCKLVQHVLMSQKTKGQALHFVQTKRENENEQGIVSREAARRSLHLLESPPSTPINLWATFRDARPRAQPLTLLRSLAIWGATHVMQEETTKRRKRGDEANDPGGQKEH